MDEEFEQARNALAVLSEASELASAFEGVSKVLTIVSSFTKVIPFVGAVLGLIQAFLPDSKHNEIIRNFEILSIQIDNVRDDIRDLEKTIKWENVKLQYGDAVARIQLGMHYCVEIGNAKNISQKMRYQERLKELCANQEFTLALNAFLDGMTGTGLFHSSIMVVYYEKTKGHRPKISSLASRLLQLVSGGMMVSATCEAATRGKEGAEDTMGWYGDRLSKAKLKVNSVLDRCRSDSRKNMLIDLNSILGKGGSNAALGSELCALMTDKYDWQEHFCLVYNDLGGIPNDMVSGDEVISLHRNRKSSIVFLRTKGVPPKFSHRYEEAKKIVNDAKGINAKKMYNNLVSKLAQRGIPWTGCVIIRRRVDLWFGGNFSTKTVVIDKVLVGVRTAKILLLQ